MDGKIKISAIPYPGTGMLGNFVNFEEYHWLKKGSSFCMGVIGPKSRNSIKLIVSLLLVMTCVVIQPAMAQKKKKQEDTPQNSRQREAEFYFTEGEKYFILEDYAKALLYYNKTLEITPHNATVHYKIAEVLSRTGKQEDLQRAAISIENALKFEEQNKYFYLLAANIYSHLAKFDKAASAYQTLIEKVPGTEEYLYELAAVYQYANKPEEAIKAYNRAEAAMGVNEVSSIQKLRLYFDTGKAKEAIAEGEKLIEAFPYEERYVMGFADVLSQKGYRDLAIKYLEKFVRDNEEDSNSKMLLAGFYRDTRQEDKARPLLLEVFDDPAIEPESKVIMLGAYNTELNHDKSDSSKVTFANQLFQKLSAAYPDNASVHISGGDLYLSTGKNREAIKEYLKAIELDEVNYEVWQNLLYLETRLEQYDNVIRHAEDALEVFPNQGMLHYFSGFAHLRKRNFAESVFSFEQAKKLISNNPNLTAEINSMLGDAYNALKQYDKSDAAYDAALAINPANDIVLNNYSYYLSLRKEHLEKAEKMASGLVKKYPDNPTYLDTYAWVLYAMEKFKDAKKIMERAIGTGKANTTHFEHYGDILFKLGDVEGAVAQWEKARGTNANNETLNKKIANRKIYE